MCSTSDATVYDRKLRMRLVRRAASHTATYNLSRFTVSSGAIFVFDYSTAIIEGESTFVDNIAADKAGELSISSCLISTTAN